MNKDMINIDDFVREKLGEQEEKRDPAAWLKMKELLDKEMPERAIPFWFRFRKPAAFVGAALLLALLSVGGYKIMTQNNTKQNTDTSNINKPKQSGTNNHQQGAVTASSINQNEKNNQPEEDNLKINHNNVTPKANQQSTVNQVAGGHHHPLNTASTVIGKAHKPNIKSDNTTQEPLLAKNSPLAKNNANSPSTQSALTKQDIPENGNKKKANGLARKAPALSTGKGTASKNIFVGNNPIKNTHTRTAPGKPTTIQQRENKPTNSTKQQKTVFAAANTTNIGNRKTTAKTKAAKQNKTIHSADNNNKTRTSNDIAATKAKTGDQSVVTTVQKQTTDSINTLTVVERTETNKGVPRKTTYKTDTVSVGKTAIAKNEQLTKTTTPAEETAATTSTRKQRRSTLRKIAAENKKAAVLAAATSSTKTEVNPAAANKNNSSSNSENVTSITKKKQKKSNGLSFISKDKVNEVVDNVKYDLGHALFYFGAIAGGNYSLSSTNSFTGMQLGFTGEIVFNKHLSLMGELKYFNRSGNRKTVNDDYTNASVIKDSSVGINNYFTIRTDSTHHYYNFSTLHSFELPITLRYAIKKFYLMTGINFAYYLTVNAEEVNANPVTNYTSVVTTQSVPLYTTMTKQLDIQDFSSKFGIGYIFGIGYQVAPAFQVDMRITKTFWDNSSTDGGKHLSKDFYQIPSIQLSIGYQFNRGKSKATFGPTSTQ